MQTKLHRWAAGDSGRRFDDLFNLVYDPAFLVHAFERVAGNAGAKTAGIESTAKIRSVTSMAMSAKNNGVALLRPFSKMKK